MNYLLDNNIVIDLLSERRRKKYPTTIEAYELLKKSKVNIYVSSSSIDNIEFILFKELKAQFNKPNKETLDEVHSRIKSFIKDKKTAKTPSYTEINFEDIEDSQIIASAKAVDAKVITRDDKMLQKYPDMAISPKELFEKGEGIKTKNPSTFSLQPSTYKIDFANLKKQYFMYLPEFEEEIDRVLNNANYIMGDAVKNLEENLCKFTGAKNAITCASGTEALIMAMMALDIKSGDEIVTTPFTFIATSETIALLGAKPVFVDIDEETYNIDPKKIEEKITDKTKAIMPVSLYGQPANLDEIQEVIDKVEGRRLKAEGDMQDPSTFNLHPSTSIKIIIDGAQSFGATYKGKAEVHYADIYTTSFFPAKPLGCFGDGGAVLTNSDELADKMRMLRVHGQNKRYHHKYIGLGARMDTLQCAIVDVKLKHYKKDLKLRQEVAQKYTNIFREKAEGRREKGYEWLEINPSTLNDRTSAWAQYSIRLNGEGRREKIQSKLKEAGIPTAVHYPMPLHLQECFVYLGYKEGDFPVAEKISQEILSLPMNPYLTNEEIKYIVKALRR